MHVNGRGASSVPPPSRKRHVNASDASHQERRCTVHTPSPSRLDAPSTLQLTLASTSVDEHVYLCYKPPWPSEHPRAPLSPSQRTTPRWHGAPACLPHGQPPSLLSQAPDVTLGRLPTQPLPHRPFSCAPLHKMHTQKGAHCPAARAAGYSRWSEQCLGHRIAALHAHSQPTPSPIC